MLNQGGVEVVNQNSIIVGCSSCGAKNRVPKERLNERPVCGKCKTRLSLEGRYPELPVDVSDQAFQREVLEFPGPVVVFYWAPWCGHCQRLMPVFDAIASEYTGKLKFAKVHLDQNPSTASQYGIQSVPTLLFFKRGRQMDRTVGALPRQEIERRLQTIL